MRSHVPWRTKNRQGEKRKRIERRQARVRGVARSGMQTKRRRGKEEIWEKGGRTGYRSPKFGSQKKLQ